MDVAVVIAEFREHLQGRGYAAKTIGLYVVFLRTFAAYLAERGITELKKVSRATLREYQAWVSEKPLAVETKALHIRVVKRLFEYLLEGNRLLVNPAEGLREIVGGRRKTGAVLSITAMERLLAQPDLTTGTGIRDRAIMEVFYSTAIRCDELVNLEIRHADFTDKTLFVRKGKGGKDRVVPLGTNAVRYLKEYLEKVRPQYALRHPAARDLFLTKSGEPVTGNLINAFLRTYAKRANLTKPVSPHLFRRTCASHMLTRGADIRHVQELLGHKRLRTTQAYTVVLRAEVKATHARTHPGVK